MVIYACETCGTYSTNDPHAKHIGHFVTGIEGDDEEELRRTAAVHLVLAPRIRAKTMLDEPDLSAAMDYARTHADWYCEEDAIYDG